MNKSRTKKMTISADLVAELDALENSALCHFTEEQDAILLKYWGVKAQRELERFWRKKWGWGSRDTLRKRYEKLTEGK